VGWALTYLTKAGLIKRVRRAVYVITPQGLEVLKKGMVLDDKTIRRFAGIREFEKSSKNDVKDTKITDQGKTPQELIEEQISLLTEDLKSELRELVLNSPPAFFEKLVIDLLLKMGYGGSREEMAKRLGRIGDEGIDGVINEDVLGLDSIYIQAKRWKNRTVGRPELQQFVGALAGKGARKGVFITTSTFSEGARRYVEDIINRQKDNMIILIDGNRLLELMINYDVGVNTHTVYKLKKVDLDYFSD